MVVIAVRISIEAEIQSQKGERQSECVKPVANRKQARGGNRRPTGSSVSAAYLGDGATKAGNSGTAAEMDRARHNLTKSEKLHVRLVQNEQGGDMRALLAPEGRTECAGRMCIVGIPSHNTTTG